MKILTHDEFLSLFKQKSPTWNEFQEKAQVRIGDRIVSLKEYKKQKGIKLEDCKLLYENIVNREDYLTRFYNMSLRVLPERLTIQEAPMKINAMNNNELTIYKNWIRNIHYEDILKNTKSGLDNVSTFLDVLSDLYLKQIIDYKILTPSSLFYMKNGRLGSVFSSYYFRASIMNPYLVYSLNKRVLKGTKIFTPTLGWSSYCNGFLQCPDVVEYVGTDVIPSVCKKTKDMGERFTPKKKIDIYCEPSENLAKSKLFINKYKNHFDVVFFSPPYYRLELYAGKEQSTEKYKTYEEWLSKYWEATIKLCYNVLQPGGKLCYILSGYGSENTKEQYNLLDDMNSITKKYFQLRKVIPMHNKDVHVTKHKETAEKIMIFSK